MTDADDLETLDDLDDLDDVTLKHEPPISTDPDAPRLRRDSRAVVRTTFAQARHGPGRQAARLDRREARTPVSRGRSDAARRRRRHHRLRGVPPGHWRKIWSTKPSHSLGPRSSAAAGPPLRATPGTPSDAGPGERAPDRNAVVPPRRIPSSVTRPGRSPSWRTPGGSSCR
jgi:hypothetical protein